MAVRANSRKSSVPAAAEVPAEELNPYRIAQQQFDTAAEYVANLPAGLREYLRRTMRMTTV
jgi:hypothetical protein